MKVANNKPKRRMMHRRQSSSLRAKIIIAIFALVIFFIATRTIGSVPQEKGGRLFLRGGSSNKSINNNLVWVHSDSQPFNDRSLATQATHLIIVAGHSVLISGDVENAARDDSVWWLYDYQRNRGLPQAIVSHIQAGIRLALEDEKSLLVFSGGETRSQTGPETEGGSYFRVADALHLWDGRDIFDNNEGAAGNNASTVRARTATEEYATDSFENLLFSICRFREVTGAYPTTISMISFSFKRQRFETLHTSALQWPASNFHYVGVDPPASTGFNLEESSEGERKNSLEPFQTDPYGCHTDILLQKRKERNPFQRTAPYPLSCPEMRELLKWCGPQLIAKGQVPWGAM